MSRRVLSAAAALAPLLAGCLGSGFPEVDNARWLGTGGTPKVKRVRDIGTRKPPNAGKLTPESDGVMTPGEFVLVEGWAFGKQPAVTIGGRPAELVANTVGGGVIVKVPPGVPAGPTAVEVAIDDARSRMEFPLRRLGLARRGAALHVFELGARGEVTPAGKPLSIPGAKAVRIASDGGCAYVVAGKKLWVIDLAAAGGPKVAASRDVTVENVTGMVAAERAPVVFVVGEKQIQAFETTDARAPARYDAVDLPEGTHGAFRAELDPEGKRLALLFSDGNKVAVVDVSGRDRVKKIDSVSVRPGALVPLVRDLRFSGDGETVWVVSGDGPGSLQAGTQPTAVTAVLLQWPEDDATHKGHPSMSNFRYALATGARAPLALAIPRGRPTESGTTIRLPPEKTRVRFSGVERALLGLTGAKDADAAEGPGAIDESDATGEGGRVAVLEAVAGPLEYTWDNERLVAVAARGEGGAREWGVVVVEPGPPSSSRFTALGTASEAELKPPFPLGEVRLQP